MSIYSTAALARSGLVSAWRLGDTSGTTAADAVGGRNGTYSGGFTLNKAGVWVPQYSAEPAARFDGSTGLVTVADSSPINLTTFTASCYFNPEAAAGASAYRVLFGKTNGIGTAGWFIALYNGLNLIAFAPTSVGSVSNPTVTLGQWHVAHLTYDGTPAAGSQVATLYLDGKQVAQVTNKTWAATSSALTIGGRSGQVSQGLVQEAFLYNRVLTAAEIAFDANALAISNVVDVDPVQRFNAPIVRRPKVVTDANYQALPTDHLIELIGATAARTITLPSTGMADGDEKVIVDATGNAATFNIAVAGGSVGASSITTNGGRRVATWLQLDAAGTRGWVVA
jgi:hypothetical protein